MPGSDSIFDSVCRFSSPSSVTFVDDRSSDWRLVNFCRLGNPSSVTSVPLSDNVCRLVSAAVAAQLGHLVPARLSVCRRVQFLRRSRSASVTLLPCRSTAFTAKVSLPPKILIWAIACLCPWLVPPCGPREQRKPASRSRPLRLETLSSHSPCERDYFASRTPLLPPYWPYFHVPTHPRPRLGGPLQPASATQDSPDYSRKSPNGLPPPQANDRPTPIADGVDRRPTPIPALPRFGYNPPKETSLH